MLLLFLVLPLVLPLGPPLALPLVLPLVLPLALPLSPQLSMFHVTSQEESPLLTAEHVLKKDGNYLIAG